MIPDYVLGKLSSEEEVAFQEALKQSPELQTELDSWTEIQQGLETIEEPAPKSMDDTFYQFLNSEIEKESASEDTVKTVSLPVRKLATWAVAASILLILGIFIGRQWGGSPDGNINNGITQEEFQSSKKETDEVRTQLVMSLADEPSAARRLEAISESKKLDTATDKVIEALFKMLNSDPNVNVRMAAVTSLSRYVDNPVVREGLVMSIVNQESPHVQIALADLMVELKEKESIRSIEELLENPSTNELVKEKLRESINQIL